MKIYTKTGDKGETSLWNGLRVSKNNIRIHAYGTVDELNAILGLARSSDMNHELDSILQRLQNDLFILGADLAAPLETSKKINRINDSHIRMLEKDIDHLESKLNPIKEFILPGGSTGAAHLHLARTVCRRAERLCYSCRDSENISNECLIYLNRLSDLLFVMARYQNHSKKIPDIQWENNSKR